MPSSLPVPSKAALMALRGLAVGTTCTVALIVEDRRRRINQAVRVIENGEKIKNYRNYTRHTEKRATGAAAALEEAAIFDAGLLRLTTEPPPLRSVLEGNADGRLKYEAQDLTTASNTARPTGHEAGTAEGGQTSQHSTTAGVGHTAEKPDPFLVLKPAPTISPIHHPAPGWAVTSRDLVKEYAFPTTNEIIDTISEASRTQDIRQIDAAILQVTQAFKQGIAPSNSQKSWLDALALLCTTCQSVGKVEDAAAILHQVLGRSKISEASYYAFDPPTLIRKLLELPNPVEGRNTAYNTLLNLAVYLYLPLFPEKPKESRPEMGEVGKMLLEAMFSANHLYRAGYVYRRTQSFAACAPTPDRELAQWFLTELFETNHYKTALKTFLSAPEDSFLNKDSLAETGESMVQCVEHAYNNRADEVLRALHGLCQETEIKLATEWAIRLLSAHWKKHKNMQEIHSLFEHIKAPTIHESVAYPDGVYRVMVELALEAGEESMAESYFEEAVAQNIVLPSNLRILGRFARFHAKNGDWQQVRETFEKMDVPDTPAARKAHGGAFVPVLKAYAEEHTVHETDEFMRSYIETFNVPVSRYMVTLMAKQYAMLRDVDAIVDWLAYCYQAGVKVGAAFSNIILINCRRQWNMPFRDLRTLFRKLRALNPDFVDEYTEKVMADAALDDCKQDGMRARGRLLSLRISPNLLTARRQGSAVGEVETAMKTNLVCRRPANALGVYKRARHEGMPMTPHVLRLAVQAQLSVGEDGYKGAYEMLRGLQEKGEDITQAVNYLLGRELGDIARFHNGVDAFASVQRSINRFEKRGIQLSASTLHSAALTCLDVGHYRGALLYANRASQLGGFGPCFNLQNFKIFVSASASLVDLAVLSGALAKGRQSSYWEKRACMDTLKHARHRIKSSKSVDATEYRRNEAIKMINEAIATTVQARAELRNEGRRFEEAALEIMKQAAIDAGCPPVDFDDIPWLGQSKSKAAVEQTVLEQEDDGDNDSDYGVEGDRFGYRELENSTVAAEALVGVENAPKIRDDEVVSVQDEEEHDYLHYHNGVDGNNGLGYHGVENKKTAVAVEAY
ncbi:ribonuclease T2 [Podospora australis]|uniref:Ribonuclease T2 n=1 Tax=Podospora australis TaxID=1536484 RepID=A0AAN7AM70_9PEZI|nr:ribonuclease T2 [Podospora australis]